MHLEVAQPRLQLAPVADVRDGEQHTAGCPGTGATVTSAHSGAVGVLEPAGAAEPGAAAAQHLAVRVPGAAVRREVDQIGGGLLRQGGGLGAEQRGEGLVGGDDDALVVDDGHREVRGVERGAVVAQFGGRSGRHCDAL